MSSYQNIPEELRDRDQWLLWDSSADTPRRPHWGGDFGVSWTDPDDWHTFGEAVQLAETRESWGIGYVFSIDNEDCARGIYGALDLDGVAVEDHGKPVDWLPSMQPFLDTGCYIEWSPSGTGLHIPIAGFSPPDWWRNCSMAEHEGVEAYGKKFFTFTGDHMRGSGGEVVDDGDWVEEWLMDVWESVRGEPAPPRQDDEADDLPDLEPGDKDSTDNAEAIADAVDRLDAQRVAERTIVQRWNDSASTSAGTRAFVPTWASGSCNGTANIVNDELWNDTGGGGIGGPLVMAAIDLGELDPRHAEPSDVSGDLWWDAVDHLRDMGFSIPEYDNAFSEDGNPTMSAADAAVADAETDGGATVADAPDAVETDLPDRPLRERVDAFVLTPLSDEDSGEDIDRRVALDRFAELLDEEYNFVRPREDIRGWRDTLYVYNEQDGIYEPHGETFIEREAERLLKSVATNQVINELVGKVSRRNYARPGELTAEPHRLVCANGIVDLHSGELEAHTPAEYHRTMIDVEYHADAECPRIDEFFHEVVDDSDVRTLYQLVAHTLHKEYIAEKAAMLLGDGQNGKSVFLSLLREFLGEYNVSQRALQDFSENNFAANELEGKLANLHPDMGDDIVRDLDTFKQLTGRDVLTADVKYEKPLRFENHATLVFAANRMPAMEEDTHALWRRWIYLNFPYTFRADDPEAKDPVPKRKLMDQLTTDAELQGLLARAVEELNEWAEGRVLFTETMGAEDVREKMKRASEPVYDFAAVCLEDTGDSDDWLPKPKVRETYRAYAKEENLPAKSEKAFGEELVNIRDYQVESTRRREEGHRVPAYTGIRLTSRGKELVGDVGSEQDGQTDVTRQEPDSQETVYDVLAELEDELEDPVPTDMVIGRASGRLSMDNITDAIDRLKKKGRIQERVDGYLETT